MIFMGLALVHFQKYWLLIESQAIAYLPDFKNTMYLDFGFQIIFIGFHFKIFVVLGFEVV